MMIITLRAGLARAGGLETSSHSPAVALELLDQSQGRNPGGKQCGSSVALCLCRLASPQVRGLSSLPGPEPSAWAEPGARRCSGDATGCNRRAKPRRMERWAQDPVGNSSLGYWPGRSLASSANIDCNQMLQGMLFLPRLRSAPQQSLSSQEGDMACPGGDASGGLFWVAGLRSGLTCR